MCSAKARGINPSPAAPGENGQRVTKFLSDEAAFLQMLTEVGWDYETATVALGYFHEYLKRREEADRIKQAALEFVASFDRETDGLFTEERPRRKAFAARVFGSDAAPEIKALKAYLFLAYDGKTYTLDATLLRHLIFHPRA